MDKNSNEVLHWHTGKKKYQTMPERYDIAKIGP